MSKFIPAIGMGIVAFILLMSGIHETQWTPAEKLGAASAATGLITMMLIPLGF